MSRPSITLVFAAICFTGGLAPSPAAVAGDKYALVVGVEHYIPTELPSLEYAEDDAEAVGAALDSLGFSTITMTTTTANPRQRSTTAAQIMEQVGKRLEDREASDTVVLAFSGHGLQFKGDPEFYFCPGEAELKDRSSLVPMGRVMAEIGRCKAGRKLVLVDACRNELTPEAAAKSGGVIELEPAVGFRAEPPVGTIALFSCQPKEKSYELKKFGHSVFTHHVIEYLTGKAAADRYPRQEVSVEELVPFVRARTRESVDKLLGARQKPEALTPDAKIPDWSLGTLGGLANADRRPAMQTTPAPNSTSPPAPARALQQQPAPAINALSDMVKVVHADNEDVWGRLFPKHFQGDYAPATLVLFSGRVRSACDMASAAAGPFYCSLDRKLYIDLAFYDELKRRFGARGDFAQAYVIAHEIGHHVQNLLGISSKMKRLMAGTSERESNQIQVRMELQADFLAGVWAHHAARYAGIIDEEDVRDAVNATAAIGYDKIENQAQGDVVPDAFTHGTSEQRVAWFFYGLKTGNPELMDRALEVDLP